MKPSRRIVFGVLFASLLLMIGILLRSSIQENVVKPLALLLWIFNRLFASIDQAVYWAGLILAGLFIAFLRMAARPMDLETDPYSSGHGLLNDMRQWRNMILLTRDETDRPNLLRQNLASLLKDVYASKHPNQVPWEIHDAIERGDIPLPDSIRSFLLIHAAPHQRPSLLQRFRAFSQLPGRLVRHWSGQETSDYYASITEVISFLEKQLESEDDE